MALFLPPSLSSQGNARTFDVSLSPESHPASSVVLLILYASCVTRRLGASSYFLASTSLTPPLHISTFSSRRRSCVTRRRRTSHSLSSLLQFCHSKLYKRLRNCLGDSSYFSAASPLTVTSAFLLLLPPSLSSPHPPPPR